MFELQSVGGVRGVESDQSVQSVKRVKSVRRVKSTKGGLADWHSIVYRRHVATLTLTQMIWGTRQKAPQFASNNWSLPNDAQAQSDISIDRGRYALKEYVNNARNK